MTLADSFDEDYDLDDSSTPPLNYFYNSSDDYPDNSSTPSSGYYGSRNDSDDSSIPLLVKTSASNSSSSGSSKGSFDKHDLGWGTSDYDSVSENAQGRVHNMKTPCQ